MRDMAQTTLSPEAIATQVAEACDRSRDALLEVVRLLLTTQPVTPADERASETRQILEGIKSKSFVSPNEAALLLNCSPQHLRNLVNLAILRKVEHPIPFCDLDGPITFPVAELLEWVRIRKPKRTRKVNAKTRRRLAGVKA